MKKRSKLKRVGIFGGSFDPPHLAHLVMAQDAFEWLGLSEVLFIPAAQAPHKQGRKQASAQERLDMMRLAVKGDARFLVSDMEIQRGGISYTIDTVQELCDRESDTEWVLLMGADSFAELDRWHRAGELVELCQIGVFLRPGERAVKEILEGLRFTEFQKSKLVSAEIRTHLLEISSTEIRDRVARGASIHYLVPAEVEAYIQEHNLYRDGVER